MTLHHGEGSAVAHCNICRIPSYNIFNGYFTNLRYLIIPREFKINRTYEKPSETYYIVAQPFKNKRHKTEDAIKSLEKSIRNRISYDRILITRETKATAIHYNIVLTTNDNIMKFHNKSFNRHFGFSVQKIHTKKDLDRVLNYTLKESKTRFFKKTKDYYIYTKH